MAHISLVLWAVFTLSGSEPESGLFEHWHHREFRIFDFVSHQGNTDVPFVEAVTKGVFTLRWRKMPTT